MHILTNTTPIDLGTVMGKPRGVLQPGRWLFHDRNAFQAADRAEPGSVLVSPYIDAPDNMHSPLLIFYAGAFGDLLLLTPAIRAFLEKHPDIKVSLCTTKLRQQLFEKTNLFDEIVDYPMPVGRASSI